MELAHLPLTVADGRVAYDVPDLTDDATLVPDYHDESDLADEWLADVLADVAGGPIVGTQEIQLPDDDALSALRAEAQAAGDHEMVATCDDALAGSLLARIVAAEAISDAVAS